MLLQGKALAEQGTYISIARMLWAFNITKALNADGKPIDVDVSFICIILYLANVFARSSITPTVVCKSVRFRHAEG